MNQKKATPKGGKYKREESLQMKSPYFIVKIFYKVMQTVEYEHYVVDVANL